MPLVCSTGTCSSDDCVELTDREFSVCTTICNSQQPVSFMQLRDSTNLHQEIVSRVVRRLSIYGLVSKVDGKYQGKCEC